ncbi:hypothetical protein [Flavobacterium silvaticum]|uniref:Uncharacterized protein n=1 Tax=Flavobacterium silvaticum TaxID=1852020 RepID=A0A972FKG3_9FLAO|nr:hypothetical protein [Flavobacterium silvaticum]NMH27332.1 hypothetical protein [Flavobacterium silvaticum]
MNEEEIALKSFNELKADFPQPIQYVFSFFPKQAQRSVFWYLIQDCLTLPAQILSPPPELV